MATISVVIPTFNRAHLVKEAIESVLKQSYKDFELVLVDDGSTDNTAEVVRSFNDPRIQYHYQPNQGVSAARDAGIKASRGEFVAFLDSDDLFLPNRLEAQVQKLAREPDAGLVYSLYYLESEGRAKWKKSGVRRSKVNLENLLFGPRFHWSTTLVRRDLLNAVGGFDPRFQVGEEWELTLRLALAGCRMVCVNEALVVVRYQPISLTREIHRHTTTSSGIIEKIFNHPGMPADLLPLREPAQVAYLLRLAGSTYLGPKPEAAGELLLHALTIVDPELELARENVDPHLRRFVSFVSSLGLDGPERTIRRVMGQLPGRPAFRRKLAARIWDLYHVEAAFKAFYGGRAGETWRRALRAILQNPRNLGNRGLVSILVRALLDAKRVRAREIG